MPMNSGLPPSIEHLRGISSPGFDGLAPTADL